MYITRAQIKIISPFNKFVTYTEDSTHTSKHKSKISLPACRLTATVATATFSIAAISAKV